MTDSRVRVHPEAIADAQLARAWYAEHDAELGVRFMTELDRAIAAIAEAPQR